MRVLTVIFLPQWFRNPYQRELLDHLSALGVRVPRLERDNMAILKGLIVHRPDVLHLHWLHPFYEAAKAWRSLLKLSVSLLGLIVLRATGTRIVWTAHNLKHHEQENPVLDRIWTRFVVRRADAIIAHCETARQMVLGEFGLRNSRRVFVVPHASYIGVYDDGVDRAAARRELGVGETAFVYLILGQIRPYKGVLELIDSFQRLEPLDAELVIAGKSLTEEATELIRARIGDAGRIKFRPGFVPDDKMQVYMNACDVFVLPYRDVLTSGAAVLAMSFGRACIAPRLGCIRDLLDEKGAFLYDAEDPEGLTDALRAAYAHRDDLVAMGAHNRRLIEPWNWRRVARITLDVYRRICPAAF
jgi:glycosyltransferase involved in cell wall biosynthesis